jgi:hypothetical protein
VSGDGRLGEPGKCRDKLSGGARTVSQDVENLAAVWIGQGGEDGVVSGPGFRHGVYFREVEGGWLIENRFPSGSEKVAEIPHGYSSGWACLNSTPLVFSSAKALRQSSTRSTMGGPLPGRHWLDQPLGSFVPAWKSASSRSCPLGPTVTHLSLPGGVKSVFFSKPTFEV